MYSGKSTLGRALAQYLREHYGVDADFIDTDQAVEERYHLTVTDCFKRYGEPMFRSLETTVLKQLADVGQSSNQAITIVSTGGGTPCFNDNMRWMNDHGLTLYLKLSVEGILKRMAVSRKPRPLLTSMLPEQRAEYVHNQIRQRQPFYDMAQLTFDGENPDLVAISQAVIEWCRNGHHKAGVE